MYRFILIYVHNGIRSQIIRLHLIFNIKYDHTQRILKAMDAKKEKSRKSGHEKP